MAEERELRFRRGDAGARDLQEVLDEIVVELRTPSSEAAAAAQEAGIDPSEIANVQIVAREEGQGIDPVTAAIIIAVASHAAEKLWDEVIWPRLKLRLGGKAVGERVK